MVYLAIWEKSKSFLVLVALLAMWQILPSMGLVDYRTLPPFSEVFSKIISLFVTGEIFKHIEISFQRSFIGFIIATSVALPIGLFMGWFTRFERIVDPVFQICRNTATLALYPIFIMLFGLGEVSKVAIIMWGALWPVIINTLTGVKNVDPLLIKSARSMAVSTFTLFYRVILPAATPSILTGLRISATHTVVVLVGAEMLGASKGLGFLIFDAQHKYQAPKMYAGIIILISAGLLLNYLLVALESRLTLWKGKEEKA